MSAVLHRQETGRKAYNGSGTWTLRGFRELRLVQ